LRSVGRWSVVGRSSVITTLMS